MASEEYVVLKVSGVDGEESMGELLGGAADFPDESELSVETRTLEPADLGAVRAERGFVSMAPSMPVALIAPVPDGETEFAARAEPEGATWGLEAVGALTSPFDGSGVVVAVLDTGIDASHEAFQGTTIVQKDFTGEGDGDEHGHGTHCAGTVFGGEVSGVRIGVAPKVSKALIGKVLNRQGGGSTQQILDGVLWSARNGANVISMSIGFDFPGFVQRMVSQGLEIEPATSRALSGYRQNLRLFDRLADLVRAQSAMFLNTLIVAAAGNESRRPRYEIHTAPPAEADGILAVGALGRSGDSATSNLKIANFSNTGPDLAAPGVGVRSARPGGGLQSMNGTSMATPHVAGVAALWYQKLQSENPGFLMTQLQGSVVANASGEFATPEDRADAGAGLVRAPQS